MQIFAGLGNPGAKYAFNRHNVGFMAIDAIARHANFSPFRKKFSALICEGTIDGEKILLIKPQTFMNLSGQSLGEALSFYKSSVEELSVLYDELDLAPAKLRIKRGGGNGGHNGIKSTESHCGKEFRRVRIGIGHPGDKARVNSHVLGDFAKTDQDWLDPMLDEIGRAFPLLVKNDESGFMNKVTLALNPNAKILPDAESKKPKGQSHIRQARTKKPKVIIAKPEVNKGPMAQMLQNLLKRD